MSGVRRGKTWLANTGKLACLSLLAFAAACSRSPGDSPASQAAQARSAERAAYQSVAKSALGDQSKILLSGDLAHNGHIQLLVVNSLPQTPGNFRDGLSIARAVILERDANDWREIFLADDHLKNENGFLDGTPHGLVNAWRLRYQQGKNGLTMLFTPLEQPAGSDSATVDVRWNPHRRRYQSYDLRTHHFLSEVPSLGGTPSFLMKR